MSGMEDAPDSSWVKMQEQRSSLSLRTKHFVVLFGVYFVLSTSLWTMALHDKREEATKYKNQLLTTQVKYEGVRDALQNTERDLADLRERLAAAAAREALAKARASRSRALAERARTSVERSSARSVVLSGQLHDITMYCPTGSRTASGKWPQRGMVATISRSIPFGTRILIEGYGEYVVEDRIGWGSEFDIFTPSCAEADRFGRHRARVTILGS